MDYLSAIIGVFVWHPGRIAVVGGMFLVLVAWHYYVRRRVCWSAILAALAWFGFAWWESLAKANGWNIRVDLIVIAPLLFVATGYGLVGAFRRPPPDELVSSAD